MEEKNLDVLRAKSAFICDMDGVIYHGNRIIPNVKEFMEWLENNNKNYLFLTPFYIILKLFIKSIILHWILPCIYIFLIN